MRYRQFGNTGMFVSELCLGTMTFGGKGSLYEIMGKLQQKEVTEIVGARWRGGELHRHRGRLFRRPVGGFAWTGVEGSGREAVVGVHRDQSLWPHGRGTERHRHGGAVT